jgi:hypothetical protein
MMKKNTACRPEQVKRCAAELRPLIGDLITQHTSLIVIAALMEHVGGGLALCQSAKVFTPEAVRAVLDRLRAVALRAI